MLMEKFTSAELLSTDPSSAVNDQNCVDVEAFDTAFGDEAKKWDLAGDAVRARAFRLFRAVSSFHFKPADRQEPFSNMASFADGSRSLMGSDFGPDDVEALAGVGRGLNLPALNVRIADLVWSRDKSKHAHARLAIDGYVSLIESVESGRGTLRFEKSSKTGIAVQNFLERAFVIARATGWDRAENDRLRDCYNRILQAAIAEGGYALVRFANLGMNYGLSGVEEALSDVATIAEHACEKGEFSEAVAIQEIAIRVESRQNGGEVSGLSRLKLAKVHEQQADAVSGSAFLQTYSLQQAIDALHGAKGVREERQRLHDKLKNAQLHLADEFATISHSVDIRDEVERILEGYNGLDLLDCLRRLALSELPKDPDTLFQRARDETEKYPLSSLFATSILDPKGRTIAKTEDGFGNSEALRHKIIQHTDLDASVSVRAAISPGRSYITQKFSVDDALLTAICRYSPFVPNGQVIQVARGLQAFIYGDDIVASAILIPFLESGLRSLVTAAGRSDTTISLGGIEQAIGLGNLLANHRDILESVFGVNQIFTIENLFVHELGPKLRHTFCHGLSGDSHCYSDTYIYGCKMIYSLVFLPLARAEVWANVKPELEKFL